MKLAILYLDVPNLGDLIIYETAKYIIEDILKKMQVENYELIPVDISSYKGRTPDNGIHGIKKILINTINRIVRKAFCFSFFSGISQEMLKIGWHLTDRYKYYVQKEKPKLEGVDIIVFAGGGLIKFHQQNFHFYIDDITQFAEQANIPVLLNAQGIEGYDESDPECQLLKSALNRNCVKYVSTRDDFAMLRNCYITNPKIVVKGVCDPAFWIPETYHIGKRQFPNTQKIGLNVIRTNIFEQYLYKDINRTFLGTIYFELIQKIDDAGYQVELFSNGIDADTKFINWLLKKYPDLCTKYKVSVATPKTTYELVHLLNGYDRFLAVRLHSAIIGTVLGVPNVSIVWNRKQILFGNEIGLPQNFITKENLQVDEIFKRLLDAESYTMDESYKVSVYQTLEEQLQKWAINSEGSTIQ